MNPLVKRSLIAAAIVAAVAGVSATAIAQGNGPQGGMAGQGPRAEQMQERMQQRMQVMQKRHAEHQAQLKNSLKITASQEAAWDAYVAATAHQPGKHEPMAREDWSKLTTPERIEKMQALRTERDATMNQRMEATKTFYAALTPEQQKVFDAQGFPGMHRMGMKGDRGGRHGKHGGQYRGMGPMDGSGCNATGPGRS